MKRPRTHPYLIPAVVLFSVFSLIPFFKVFQLSVFEWDGISTHMDFVGLGNFATAIFHDSSWWISMRTPGIDARATSICPTGRTVSLSPHITQVGMFSAR